MTIFDLISDKDYQHKNVLYKIISHVCEIKKDDMIKHYDDTISQDKLDQIVSMYIRYSQDKEPLEYIVGYVEFLGNKFILDSRSLIPRAETEYMIQAVTEYLHIKQKTDHNDKSNLLIDVGTGCGVLGLSVLLKNPTYFDTAILTEYYEEALSLAKENFMLYRPQINNLETHVVRCDLLDFITWADKTHSVSFPDILDTHSTVLVANLPYIPDDTFEQNADESAKKREPRAAFLGGKDGLDLYRRMFDQLFDYKVKGITMFLEMMTRQVEILEGEYGDKIDFSIVKTFHFNIVIVKGELIK